MLARAKWQVPTIAVLEAVFQERTRQVALYGHNEDLEDGTGPDVPWLGQEFDPSDLITATEIEHFFREDYDQNLQPTWLRLVREELAEAFKEDPALDNTKLDEELIQVAALCVSWVEKRRKRRLTPGPEPELSATQLLLKCREEGPDPQADENPED